MYILLDVLDADKIRTWYVSYKMAFYNNVRLQIHHATLSVEKWVYTEIDLRALSLK